MTTLITVIEQMEADAEIQRLHWAELPKSGGLEGAVIISKGVTTTMGIPTEIVDLS